MSLILAGSITLDSTFKATFFYTIQACMGRWVEKYTKNNNYFGFGPDIRHYACLMFSVWALYAKKL